MSSALHVSLAVLAQVLVAVCLVATPTRTKLLQGVSLKGRLI